MRDLEAFGLIVACGDGQSSIRERKRVRETLLANFRPFTNALADLKSTMECYVDFWDNLQIKKFERDWSVKLFIKPKYMVESISEEAYYLCDLSPMSSKAELIEYGDFVDEPPELVFKDNLYQYPKIWYGTPQDEQYPVYVGLPSDITNSETQEVLQKLKIGKRTTNLNDTSNAGLAEKIELLKCLFDQKMNLSQATKYLNPDLDTDSFVKKRPRYSKLKRQLLEIIDPPIRV